jgi:hypothetical protein
MQFFTCPVTSNRSVEMKWCSGQLYYSVYVRSMVQIFAGELTIASKIFRNFSKSFH